MYLLTGFFSFFYSLTKGQKSFEYHYISVGKSMGLFPRREGYPSKRVNPSRRAKDSPGLQAKFDRYGSPTTRDNLTRGYT